MNKKISQSGFTLIETLVAIGLLTIGILSLYSMQVSAIQGNSHANQLTTSANWAADRIEILLGRPYTDPLLNDTSGDGVAGLGNTLVGAVVAADYLYTQDALGNDVITANGLAAPANAIPYSIYWNVAVDATTPNTKTIRVITIWNDRGQQKSTVVDYVKASVR